jgi:hypothetical protein
VGKYLVAYINQERIEDPSPWVDKGAFQRVAGAIASLDTDQVGPIHRALGGGVDYDLIRISIALLRNGNANRDHEWHG